MSESVRRPRFALSAPLPLDSQRAIEEAQAWLSALGDQAPGETPSSAVRPEVWASWKRSVAAGVDPELGQAPHVRGAVEVESTLADSRWRAAVDVLGSMLVDDASADAMAVALTDATGVVVWTGGSLGMGRRAAAIGLVPGTCWGEDAVGTNALGSCLVTGACSQVLRAEHHLVAARSFAGAAAPVRGRDGRTWGAVGLVGGDHVATPAVLALVRFVAAALSAAVSTPHDGAVTEGGPATRPVELSVLGRSRGVLRVAGTAVELSPKHTDLLVSLAVAAQRDQGRTAEELACDCWETETPTATVRAEMHRLRRLLPGMLVSSQPYRLGRPLQVDALQVLALLRRGSHRRALELYRGPLLPRSVAPSTAHLRQRVTDHLRQALVAHGHVDLLLAFADRGDGDELSVWQAVVDRMPVGSSRHTEAVLRLAEVEARLLGF